MWTVALSTAVAKLLGTVLATRLRWFLYCLWCGGPEPPTGGLAPGESATALAEELLETKVAAERQASFGTGANPLLDVIGKNRRVYGHAGGEKASRGAGGCDRDLGRARAWPGWGSHQGVRGGAGGIAPPHNTEYLTRPLVRCWSGPGKHF